MKSLPVTKKLPHFNNQKPKINNLRNQDNLNRPAKQFSVRKTNTIISNKNTNKNFRAFEQAKNTILGNIQILDKLK